MKPKNRNISLGMKGEDVERLHESLRLLGFTIEDEIGYFGESTHQAVIEFQKTHGLEPNGVVDERTAEKIKEEVDALRRGGGSGKRYLVQGKVLQPDGIPVKNMVVKAFDKDLRREKLLGKDTTNTEGKYNIPYTISQREHPDKSRPDLVVRAYNEDGEEIATSPLIINASPKQTVDLVVGNAIYRGPSEYTQTHTKVEPLLKDTDITELTEEDVAYLAGKTGLNPVRIACFIQGTLLAQEIDIPAEVFYGLFRQDLPTNLPALSTQEPEAIRKALKTAVRQNIISPLSEESINQVLEQFKAQAVNQTLSDKNTFSGLLTTANLPKGKQEAFLQAYFRHEGPREVFWKNLREDPEFGDESVKNIQSTLELGALTQNHLPLVKVLQKKQQSGEISSLRDLADLDQQDWVNYINQEIDGNPVGVPPTIPGENEEEKINNYAHIMMKTVENAFPTAVITHTMKDDDFPYAKGVAEFFVKNPDFEFSTMQINTYLAENENALDGIKNADQVKAQIKGVQRLFTIAPPSNKYDPIKTLMADNVTSSYAIRQMGKAAFVETYSSTFGAEQTVALYNNASQNAAKAQMLFSQYSPAVNNFGFFVLPFIPSWVKQMPEWESLFGSLDLCECEHCRSVYSPAAYLVDILHFLKNCKTNDKPALDVLFERRSDIGDIELTCKNTNTVIPYVDIVNEALENAIAPSDNVYQTEGTAKELRIYPEHLNIDAYKVLADAVYPWTLPFDLPAEEIRMYLKHLGVPRHNLMKRFRNEGRSTTLDIASEHLGLTAREWDIIAGTASDGPYAFWGMGRGNWANQLKTVSTFLKKSGLCYKKLQKLLKVQYINPDNEMYIKISATCDLDKEKIVNLKIPALGRIHRFVRLQQKLNWSIRQLDAALLALPPHDLSEGFLVNLSHVLHLHTTLKVPLIPLLSWWSTIDTVTFRTATQEDEPSLYEKLFLNKTVMNPPDTDFELDEIAKCKEKICDHIPAILSALRISEDDLALIIKEELLRDELTLDNLSTLYPGAIRSGTSVKDVGKLVKKLLSNAKLTLKNLSALYRTVSLAKALNLSLRDFLSLRLLSSINPFDAHNIAATVRFVKMAEVVRASGFSIVELDYLLRHQYQPNSAVAPSEKEISLLLGELIKGLQKIAQEYRFTSDPTGEKTAQHLTILLSEEKAKKALAVVDGSSTEDSDDQKAFIKDHFTVFLDAKKAIKNLVDNDIPKEEKEKRFDYVLKALLTYLKQTMSKTLVKQKLADALSLTMEASELLLSELVPSREDPAKKAIDDFLALSFVKNGEDPVSAEDFPTQFDQFILLHKIATIITRFDIPSEELAWLFQQGPGLGWLDLNTLPLTKAKTTFGEVLFEPEDIEAGKDLFKAWFEMAKMAHLRDELPKGEPTLFALLKMLHDNVKDKAKFITALCERTHWHKEDLEFFMGPQSFDLDFPTDYQNEKALEQLIRFKRCFELIKVLGVSAEKIWEWNAPNMDFDKAVEHAHCIRQAIRAKYEETQWLKIAEPLRDTLREQQRKALVAYKVHIMNDPDIEDGNDLLGYFLIDVEMSPCMMTSRIKQAISSVQLFVNRCLMNLETDVTITPEKAKEWEWMKNYRVWEANRKVFLYPENWIEPELRDNKSPFFVDLENELLQNEVTKDTAEGAFLNYLEKLDEVARLEICGMYFQSESASNILHVFGRTRGTPHIYYYRKRINRAYWTPWERIDVDIEGDHLIPFVYNRRLYLFWPLFREKADENVSLEENTAEKPFKYYEIQLAWTEYKDGKWLAKRISNKIVKTSSFQDPLLKRFFRFWAYKRGNDLIIAPEIREDNDYGNKLLEQFKFIGCDGQVEIVDYNTADLEPIPFTSNNFMKFIDSYGGSSLELKTTTILNKTPGTFNILLPHQYRPFTSYAPFFYEDSTRTFFVDNLTFPELLFVYSTSNSAVINVEFPGYTPMVGNLPDDTSTEDEPSSAPISVAMRSRIFMPLYRFDPFYHPYVPLLINQLNRYGIDGLLNPDPGGETPELRRQLINHEFFQDEYEPLKVGTPFPKDKIDFSLSGAYSLYNWELFFHTPFHIAHSLSKNQRFAEAQKWYHYIFDPTDVSEDFDPSEESYPARFWKIKPFYKEAIGKPIQDSMLLLKGDDLTEEEKKIKEDLEDQIKEWRANPFQPHLIARMRPIAYQKAIVMKYLDNLIAWGDYLFRQDSIESINEATQLYVLAAQILGKRPEDIPAPEGKAKLIDGKEIKTFNDLEPHLDEFSNAIIDIETDIPVPEEEFPDMFIDPFVNIVANVQAPVRDVSLDLITKVKTNVDIISSNIIVGDHINGGSIISTNIQPFVSFTEMEKPIMISDNPIESSLAPEERHDNVSNVVYNVGPVSPIPVAGGDPSVPIPVNVYPPVTPVINVQPALASLIELNIVEDEAPTTLVIGPTLFFCTPRNEKLLSYWDTVGDRLFKIRYCMNIEGVVRQLPLFQPPIEPGLLVRAAAAGIDIGSVLNDLNAPLPHYRFQIMLQKALELCNDVKSLGAALLSALEKRDAEELALLRSSHEVNLLKAVRHVKEQQIEESDEALKALERSKETAKKRKEYYESREYKNVHEKLHIAKLESANEWQTVRQGMELAAGSLSLLPQWDNGFSGWAGTPVVKVEIGGVQLSSAVQCASRAMSIKESWDTYSANRASIKGGWDRRMDDWTFQAEQADKEMKHIEKQIDAAKIRSAITEQELTNHDLQIENTKEVDVFMRDKFTNNQLYSWMVSQISTIYFQSYQMAYDLAKRAEKGFRHEIGDPDVAFIQFGYWDSLKKGLLAGERLHYDLKRMEMAYYDQNKREYEITKHISLAILHPEALIMLKETGECYITLPEAIFDLDYPGHYMRRIKSVSLTMPCVTGPYTNVSCTLTLLSNRTRQTTTTEPDYVWQGIDDLRFIYNVGNIQSIVTSSAREDSGLFELNFRDERYLPFEGAGAISTWRIELPRGFKQFDYDTISDVIIHVRYTAREGGANFKGTVETKLKTALESMVLEIGKTGLFRLFSAKREFPNQWHQFLHPKAGEANHMDFKLEEKFFPFQFKGKITKITCQKLFVKLKDAISTNDLNSFTLAFTSPDGTEFGAPFAIVSNTEDKLLEATFQNMVIEESDTLILSVTGLPDSLKAKMPDGTLTNHLDPDAVEDIGILCPYSIEGS